VFEARGTYTGSVTGRSGSFDLVFAGNIDATGHALGSLVVIRGAGGLADLHGLLRLEGQSGVGGTYTGTVNFAS